MVVGEEEVEEEVEDDDEYYNFIGVVEKVLMAEADLETPVQSPLEAPPNSPLKEVSGLIVIDNCVLVVFKLMTKLQNSIFTKLNIF